MQFVSVEKPIIELLNISGKFLKNVSFTALGITCVLGEWGNDKEELSKILTFDEKPKGGKVTYYSENPKKYIRLIPRERIDSELKVYEILRLYEKRFGKSNDFWNSFFEIPKDRKVKELSEYEKFKLELLQIFYGKTKFILAEDFTETFEEQLKGKAVKTLVKTARIINSTLVLFLGSSEFNDVCERRIVIYGGEVIEESEKNNELYHPYSVLLSKARLTIGKRLERINIDFVSDPAKSGCPFHPYCGKSYDKRIRKMCITENPPFFTVNGNRVRCWYFS